MFKLLVFLLIIALSTNLVVSWDIAVTSGNQIEFYDGVNRTVVPDYDRFTELTALAFDAIYNILLFVDKQSDNASIFSYNITSKEIQLLVTRGPHANIDGIAFDPVTGKLFWTDSKERSIYWRSLNSKSDSEEHLLFKMDNEIPSAIAVDSCRGYIYWTNLDPMKPSIDRARFDKSDKKTIVTRAMFNTPVSLIIDQKTKSLYWAEKEQGIHYSIESSDLEGHNRRNLVAAVHEHPRIITVSKDAIYWVVLHSNTIRKVLQKDTPIGPDDENKVIKMDSLTTPFGLVANYPIADQTEGRESDCEALIKLPSDKTYLSDSFIPPREFETICVNGVKMVCKCKHSFDGRRCESYACRSGCGPEHARCNASCGDNFIGKKYDIDNENTALYQSGAPKHGSDTNLVEVDDRQDSETKSNEVVNSETENPNNVVEVFKNIVHETKSDTYDPKTNYKIQDQSTKEAEEFVDTVNVDGWDPVRDPIIIVLGILCGTLCAVCSMLVTKILHLKKRPRIKKRIIVNKNVTPLTARPDQCEITIENCCNMNICETPCFEPRSTIKPTLLDAKPGKEEKKNLIANMEHADDLY